ncbi:MFS transporter [Sphingosinicella rhizophila]|uniref:MFS transporter n=1 Tax=Sphingosinicella rhizophila TaxID=3050082 RepID=A0ABU3Q8T8_9SPHN|nr:MFS transporter [Sphingosinicella sp. GR2756]MDT9599812.1 MFS transporter [Sphingosinicella sp. GR2756]
MTGFHKILANSLIAGITNATVWFAVTFWTFLETRSVFATGMIAGSHLVLTAMSGMWFGSLVDHHPKKYVMLGSSLASFLLYLVALAVHLSVPERAFTDVGSVPLWLFILPAMLGVIAGNVRAIALPTLVTAMIPADRRDKANGLVGMVGGVGFLVTSAMSGYLVAKTGMTGTMGFALVLTFVAFVHLLFVRFDMLPEAAAAKDGAAETRDGAQDYAAAEAAPAAPKVPKRVDIRGTILVIGAVPGLFALIFFACFNNMLGGVFMALMDAYGLSLMKVEQWGLLWAFLSCAFILSGMVIAKIGLGPKPLRTLLLVNLISWAAAALFTVQSSILLLTAGCFIFLFFGPFAEAAEHTTLQKVVPYERQGRVFGFAQSVELAASPLTAFLIGPLTQFLFIPFMTDGAGADAIGDWYGRGPERGIALVFTVAGLFGVALTLFAFGSKYYRQLSAAAGTDKADGAAPAANLG